MSKGGLQEVYCHLLHDSILAHFTGTLGDIFKFFKKSLNSFLYVFIRVPDPPTPEHAVHPSGRLRIATAVYKIQPKHNTQIGFRDALYVLFGLAGQL